MISSITSHPFTVDLSSVMPYLGAVSPVVVAALTKLHASSKLKSFVGLFVAAAIVLITRSVDPHGHAVFQWTAIGQFAMVWGIQLGTYLGIWQHLGINEKVLPSVGVGPAAPAGPVAPVEPSADTKAIIEAIERLIAAQPLPATSEGHVGVIPGEPNTVVHE